MARKRSLDPDIWGDSKFLKLSTFAKVIFLGCISLADDEGILEVSPITIKFKLGLLESEQDIEISLIKLQELQMIVLYQNNELAYLPNFLKHQTIQFPVPTKYQRPPKEKIIGEYEQYVTHILYISATRSYGTNWISQKKNAKFRDKNECRLCKSTNDLEVHHIMPLIEFNGEIQKANRLTNLITLCSVCHEKYHKGEISRSKLYKCLKEFSKLYKPEEVKLSKVKLSKVKYKYISLEQIKGDVEQYEKLQKTYPNLNLKQEFLKMERWVEANPNKAKLNWLRFVVNWLNRAGGYYGTNQGRDNAGSGENKPKVSKYGHLSKTLS